MKKNGIKAYDCTVNNGTSQTDVLRKICEKCNSKIRDIDISIHFNSADHQRILDRKTTGTEVWVRDTTGVKGDLSKRICNQLSKIGFRNRGVKTTSGLWVLNKTQSRHFLLRCVLYLTLTMQSFIKPTGIKWQKLSYRQYSIIIRCIEKIVELSLFIC